MRIVLDAFYRSTTPVRKKSGGRGGGRQNGIETAIASSATPDSRISIRVAPSHVHVISTRYSYVRARQKEVKAKERKNTSHLE